MTSGSYRSAWDQHAGTPNVIGLVTGSIDGDYWRRVIAGLCEHLEEQGFTLLCFAPGNHAQYPNEFLDLVREEHLSGIVISPSSFQSIEPQVPDASTEASRSTTATVNAEDCLQHIGNLSVVYVGRWTEGAPSVWVQNRAGIRLLMTHLTEVCGRRRIAFVRGPDQHVEAEARFRAWNEFCIEHSLPHDEELSEAGGFTLDGGELAAHRILERNASEPPDAFVVSNDQMAVGVLRALSAAGLSVPEDVSVVGFDDLEADTTDPPLTTVRQPVFEMGYRAAEVLLKRLRQEPVALEHMFTPELVVRDSSRPDQRGCVQRSVNAGTGACVFLKGAYSSTDWLMPLLRQTEPTNLEPDARQSIALERQHATDLALGLRRSQAREREFVACIGMARRHAYEQLEQELTSVESLTALNQVVRQHLPLLGLDRITLAALGDRATTGVREARVSIQASTSSPPTTLDLPRQLACHDVLASEVRMPGGRFRLAQPLQIDGAYWGFLVLSGMLLDDQLVNDLGDLLMRAVVRLEQART
jgi:DNA-binding LacI/PurR family transcriptional regulator